MKLVVQMPWEKNLSVNHCNMGPRGNWHLKRGPDDWKQQLGWVILGARIEETGGRGGYYDVKVPVVVVVDMRFPDKRLRDCHNFHYLIANGVAAGLGIDDTNIRILTGTVEIDRDNPGFTITVEDEG